MGADPVAATARAALCPVCQDAVAAGEEVVPCPGCGARHHRDCWQEVGGCGVYGCAHVPPTEKRGDLEIPAGYWGRESKPCPRCGMDIQAMAVRCRHCGAEMSAGASQTGKDWRAERAEVAGRAGLARRCLWVFVLCVVPPLAPFAVVPATAWLLLRRRAIARIGSLHRALAVIGVILAWLMCVGLVVALAIAKAASHHGH